MGRTLESNKVAVGDMGPVFLDATETERWLASVFEACGMTQEHAPLLAYGVIQPSMRGIDTHGLYRMPQYVENLRVGQIKARPSMQFVVESGSIAVLDADNGSGHVAAMIGMRRAIETARAQGVGLVSIRNSSHYGASGTWAMLAVEADCIGLMWTNGNATMPPTGGAEARVHNAPLAIAVPAGKHPPLLLDIAMSAVAGAKVRLAAMKGETIPAEWSLTPDGRITTDAREALNGLLLPMGGHKGYGLAVMADVLAGILSGSSFSMKVNSQGSVALGQRDPGRIGSVLGVGHFCLAIDPAQFLSLDTFKAQVDALIDGLHETPLQPGANRILVPGELEADAFARRVKEGIPVDPRVLNLITDAAASVGLELPEAIYAQ